MNLRTLFLISLISFAVTGCATKRYPIATPLSADESSVMSCQDLELEMAKTREVRNQIEETGEFDGRTGIGNAMAKEDARDALAERVATIEQAQSEQGCSVRQAMTGDHPGQ